MSLMKLLYDLLLCVCVIVMACLCFQPKSQPAMAGGASE